MAIVYRWPRGGQIPDGMPHRRAAVYERTASDSAVSLQRQEEAIRSYLADHPQWRVVAVYRDAGASAFHRPELQRALRSAEAGEFDGLIVHGVDRLARRIDELADIITTLRRAQVTLHSTTEPLDTSTQPGRLIADLLQVFADFARTQPDAVIARTGDSRRARRRHRPARHVRRRKE
jgi:site-specific DNA recombinase